LGHQKVNGKIRVLSNFATQEDVDNCCHEIVVFCHPIYSKLKNNIKTLREAKARLVLPPNEKHMLLVDNKGETLAEIWDYKLRQSIESGETNLSTSKLVQELYEHALWQTSGYRV